MPEGMMMPEQQPIQGPQSERPAPLWEMKGKGPTKPPIPPKPTALGGGEGTPQAELVPDFMRRMTRNIEAVPWEDTKFLGHIHDPELLENTSHAFFADVFWSAYTFWGHESFTNDQLPFRSRALDKARFFIVGYKSNSGYRHDLLALVPDNLHEPVTTTISSSSIREDFARYLQYTYDKMGFYYKRSHFLHVKMRLLMKHLGENRELLDEFLEQASPSIVFASLPPIQLHKAIPSPALPVAASRGAAYTSSVGVIAHDTSGKYGVTVAYHALQNGNLLGYLGQTVDVNGVTGTVSSIDAVSDSAFVNLPGGSNHIPARPFASVRTSPAPGYGEEATFDGCASGPRSTVVVATPPTLLNRNRFVQRHLLTNPDTSPGDSGCALLNKSNDLLGFCLGGTGINSPIMYSLWIWADSVFAAHNLR